jgi:hypothetical protein
MRLAGATDTVAGSPGADAGAAGSEEPPQAPSTIKVASQRRERMRAF